MRAWTLISAAVAATWSLGCAATDDNTGGGGGAGVSGSAGSGGAAGTDGGAAGTGGSAGTSGAAGTGGSAGTSGAAGTGGGGGASGAGGSAGSAGCPTGPGPTMVSVGSFCIDSTEVTNAHYEAFLSANPSTSSQAAVCAFNTSFVPSSAWPASAKPDLPVRYVDWCDAYAYCQWAGKRLCGKIGGGPNAFGDVGDPFSSQWLNACSSSGFYKYPYGNTYEPNTCNGVDHGTQDALPVGQLSGCQGGTPGIYDMSGNVWEWEDSCQTQNGATDQCRLRGGSFWFNGESDLTCANPNANDRSAQNDIYGFRCCAP